VRVYAGAGEFSGVVLVARGEEVLLHRACGFAAADHGISNAVETHLRVASLTKIFTAAAVLLFAQEGQLALVDTLARLPHDYTRSSEINPRAPARPGVERSKGSSPWPSFAGSLISSAGFP
jgi:CubicO group peptidase (beta-lactamase class C family)